MRPQEKTIGTPLTDDERAELASASQAQIQKSSRLKRLFLRDLANSGDLEGIPPFSTGENVPKLDALRASIVAIRTRLSQTVNPMDRAKLLRSHRRLSQGLLPPSLRSRKIT